MFATLAGHRQRLGRLSFRAGLCATRYRAILQIGAGSCDFSSLKLPSGSTIAVMMASVGAFRQFVSARTDTFKMLIGGGSKTPRAIPRWRRIGSKVLGEISSPEGRQRLFCRAGKAERG